MALYYMFNKPRGCVTARSDSEYKTVMDYFPEDLQKVIHPVGRLDFDTEGLLIVTDDGMLDHQLMQPNFHVEKKYFFWAFGTLDKQSVKDFENGIVFSAKGQKALPAHIEILEHKTVEDISEYLVESKREQYLKNPTGKVFSGYITITEGKKHQVKRMLKAKGCTVAYLKRIAIENLQLDDKLALGSYRSLTEDEVLSLIPTNRNA